MLGGTDEHFVELQADTTAELRVWRVNSFEIEEVAEEDIGVFFDGDCYLVLDSHWDLKQRRVYMWIGALSSQDKRAVCSIKAAGLHYSASLVHPTVRIEQEEENSHEDLAHDDDNNNDDDVEEMVSEVEEEEEEEEGDEGDEGEDEEVVERRREEKRRIKEEKLRAREERYRMREEKKRRKEEEREVVRSRNEEEEDEEKREKREERKRFVSLFPCYLIRSGGSESGLRPLTPDYPWPRMFCIRQRPYPHPIAVEYAWSSLRANSVSIIDQGHHIHMWVGEGSNIDQRALGMDLMCKLKHFGSRLDGCRLSVSYQGQESEELWESLGMNSPPSPHERIITTTIDEQSDSIIDLYRIAPGESEPCHVEPSGGGRLLLSHLQTQCVYMFDCDTIIFVWKGRKSSAMAKAMCMAMARDSIPHFNRPYWCRVVDMMEGHEDPVFLSHFPDRSKGCPVDTWQTISYPPPDVMEVGGAAMSLKAVLLMPPNEPLPPPAPGWMKSLGAALSRSRKKDKDKDKHKTPPKRSFELSTQIIHEDEPGSGELLVYMITTTPHSAFGGLLDHQLIPVEKTDYGVMNSNAAYLCLYSYLHKGALRHLIYLWEGVRCPGSVLVWWKISFAPDFLAALTDAAQGSPPVFQRVHQFRETAHFLSLFQGPLIVMNTPSDRCLKSTGLYRVCAVTEAQSAVVQVGLSARALCSNSIFVLATTDCIFLWLGRWKVSQEDHAAQQFVERLCEASPREVVDMAEGRESTRFWQCLGGKKEYGPLTQLMGVARQQQPKTRVWRAVYGPKSLILEEVDGPFVTRNSREVLVVHGLGKIWVWCGLRSSTFKAELVVRAAQQAAYPEKARVEIVMEGAESGPFRTMCTPAPPTVKNIVWPVVKSIVPLGRLVYGPGATRKRRFKSFWLREWR